jgi:hypothetical protein
MISDMSTLDPAVFFDGPSEIGNNDLAKMEVANFSTDVDQALSEHFGWRGKATAVVGLTLSADNLRVEKGEFITRGDLDLKEKKLAANTIWPEARANISLHITFPSANVFTFESGGLWSNLVPASQIVHSFHDTTEGRGGRPLLDTDERLEGTEDGFSVRMVAQLSSLSSATKGIILRAAIMLFPASAETLSDTFESRYRKKERKKRYLQIRILYKSR